MIDSVAEAGPKTPASLRRRLLHLLPLLLVLAVLGAVLASGVWKHISLADLKARRAVLKAFVQGHPVQSLLLYVALYGAVVALSIPGALIMTLTGGFLFGTVEGGLAASCGVTVGAVVMFLVAHTALGDVIRRYAAPEGFVRRMEAGVRRHAFLYIFSLRLLPAVPIWMVNIAAAFVKTPLWIYSSATFLGILPPTLIYASVGASLDRVFAAGGAPTIQSVFQPPVIASLFALGALALAPFAYQFWRARSRKGADV